MVTSRVSWVFPGGVICFQEFFILPGVLPEVLPGVQGYSRASGVLPGLQGYFVLQGYFQGFLYISSSVQIGLKGSP